MDCCTNLRGDDRETNENAVAEVQTASRREVLGLMAGAAVAASGVGFAQRRTLKKLQLAFCGQLLCVIPYEAARARGYFAQQGLEVELVYTRGGSAAMQALVGGAVDYAATALDVALQAYNRGARILRFASTGQLPLFALAVGPKGAATVRGVADLAGRTVGVSALGNADHALLLFLLRKAGVDPKRVQYAALGTNLFEPLRAGQVDAGMIQEPALSLLLEAGGRSLVNLMDLQQARARLGGAYEFMGVAVRATERDARLDEMKRLTAALQKGLNFVRTANVALIAKTLPAQLIAGGDRAQLEKVIERYRRSLYPASARIDLASARRVVESQQVAELLPRSFELDGLLDLTVAGAR